MAVLFAGCGFARAELASLEVVVAGPSGQPVLDAVVSLHAIDPETGAMRPVQPVPRVASSDSPRAIMDQVDLTFVPHVLSIETGTLVDFPNKDQVRHSIYSFSATRIFEVKLYKGHEVPPVYFDRPGLVVLGCNIHDDMLAYIYVHETPHSVVTGEDGRARIENITPGTYAAIVRHPRLDANPVDQRRLTLSGSETLQLTLPVRPPPRPNPEGEDDLDGLFGWIVR